MCELEATTTLSLDVKETNPCGECHQHRENARRGSNLGEDCLLEFISKVNAELEKEVGAKKKQKLRRDKATIGVLHTNVSEYLY